MTEINDNRYERSYGYLYEQLGKYPTTAEIAKAIRDDIKTAVVEGLLPSRWTYSVRGSNFAGGCAIDVHVRDCDDAWIQCPGYKIGNRHETPGGGWTAAGCGDVWCKAGGQYKDSPSAAYHDVMGEEAVVAQMTLERIHGAYNHDGSDSMTDYCDVRYYGHVEFETARSRQWRLKEAARKAERKARKAGR